MYMYYSRETCHSVSPPNNMNVLWHRTVREWRGDGGGGECENTTDCHRNPSRQLPKQKLNSQKLLLPSSIRQ